MIAAVVSLFLTGFVSLIGQIVLLRELNVAFFGVELIYLIALGVWLLLTALGTIAVRRRASPSRIGRRSCCFCSPFSCPSASSFSGRAAWSSAASPAPTSPFPVRWRRWSSPSRRSACSRASCSAPPPCSMQGKAGRWPAPMGSKARAPWRGDFWPPSASGGESRISRWPSPAASSRR